MLHTQFLIIDILHQYGTFIIVNDLVCICYYQLKSILYSDFLSFSLMSFFCSRIPSRDVTFSHHFSLGSSWLWKFLTLSLFLMTLRKTGLVVYGPKLRFFWHFYHDYTAAMNLGEETTEVKSAQHRVPFSAWLITDDADFDHLDEVVFVKFLHCKIPLSIL